MWYCSAYKKSLTIFPDGIAPCCMIKSYKKPLSDIRNKNAFDDLITGKPPSECNQCVIDESRNLYSYRRFFNDNSDKSDNLQFIDIRNSNLCNLKCRICGPHASNQWGKEQNNIISIIQSDPLEEYYDILLAPSIKDFYFTGGEPMIIQEHWTILEKLIELGYSKNIQLRYNTNLTVLKYKDKDTIKLWNQFKKVIINCSLDATKERFNYIRSGGDWNTVEKNLIELLKYKNLYISIAYTVSILNIWNMNDDLKYFASLGVPVRISILDNPDILSIESIPDELKSHAIETLKLSNSLLSKSEYDSLLDMIMNNRSKHLFKSTLGHILYLDKIRNEKLFDQLPFKDIAYDLMVKNA